MSTGGGSVLSTGGGSALSVGGGSRRSVGFSSDLSVGGSRGTSLSMCLSAIFSLASLVGSVGGVGLHPHRNTNKRGTIHKRTYEYIRNMIPLHSTRQMSRVTLADTTTFSEV